MIVDIEGITGQMTTMELCVDGGERIRLMLDTEADYGTDLEHLHDHMRGGMPVSIQTEQDGNTLRVIAVEDASGPIPGC